MDCERFFGTKPQNPVASDREKEKVESERSLTKLKEVLRSRKIKRKVKSGQLCCLGSLKNFVPQSGVASLELQITRTAAQ